MSQKTFKPTAFSKTVGISNIVLGGLLLALALFSITSIAVLIYSGRVAEIQNGAFDLSTAIIFYFIFAIGTLFPGINILKRKKRSIHTALFFNTLFSTIFIVVIIGSLADSSFSINTILFALPVFTLTILTTIFLRKINQLDTKSKTS